MEWAVFILAVALAAIFSLYVRECYLHQATMLRWLAALATVKQIQDDTKADEGSSSAFEDEIPDIPRHFVYQVEREEREH